MPSQADEVHDLVPVAAVHRPDPADRAVYDQLFAEFPKLYRAQKGMFSRLAVPASRPSSDAGRQVRLGTGGSDVEGDEVGRRRSAEQEALGLVATDGPDRPQFGRASPPPRPPR